MRASRERTGAIRRVLLVELGFNVAVAAAKAGYGILAGSLAIATDALHSLADAGSNIVGLVVMHFASAPPDADHPYGHRKLEVVAAAGIGVAIFAVALRFGYSAVESLVHGPSLPDTSAVGFAVIILTLLVNIGVARYEARRARELSSAYLAADAAHTASDVLVTGAVLLSFAAAHYGVDWADPVGALLVVLVIVRVAWRILIENLSVLIDRAAIDTAAVESIALENELVRGCHRVRSRGPAEAVQVDLHLSFDAQLSLREAHTAAHDVEAALRERIPQIADVTIHMEPEDDADEPDNTW